MWLWALWSEWRSRCFFQISEGVFQKWTFINVHFSFFQNRFEKNDAFIHFGVRHPNLRGVTFMLWIGDEGSGHVATIMLRILEFFIYRYKIYIMGYKLGYIFLNKLSILFFGDVSNIGCQRWIRIIPSDRMAVFLYFYKTR